MVSVSKLISTITSSISAVFDTSVSVEEQQQRVDQRVSRFVNVINNASYFNGEHEEIHGRDVLRRVEELGIALGADPDFSKEKEYGPPTPAGMASYPTPHAKSIGTSDIGFETNGTPYVRVPTHFEDGSEEHFIQALEELASKVEGYREDPSQVEGTFKDRADSQLKSLYRTDRDAYEAIVKHGGQSPNIDGANIMLATEHQGEGYTSEDGSLITIQSATDALLEREPAEEKLLEA